MNPKRTDSEVKHAIIKTGIESNYKKIKEANEELERLRKECDHPETKLVNYMWAPGHINPDTEVCSFCGEVIPGKNQYIIEEPGKDGWTCDDCGNSVYNCKCDPC